MEKVIGLIPARMGSSRFPGKPLVNINDYPMIYWVYNQARQCDLLEELYIVTPDKEIKERCVELDIPYLFDTRQGNTAAQKLSYEANKLDGTIYLNIQGDEPLLDPKALNQIVNEMVNNPDEYYVGLYSLIKTEEEFRNRNVVKTVLDKDGYAMYFSRSPIPEIYEYGKALRVMGLYGYRDWFLKKYSEINNTELEKLESGIEMIRMLENGYKIKFLETDYETVGVDLPEHISLVEKEMIKRKNRK